MSNSNLLMPPTRKDKLAESFHSERKLDKEKLINKNKVVKKFATLALALTIVTSIGVAERSNIGKIINNATYIAVDKDTAGPKLENGGIGKPNKIDMIGDISKLTVMSRNEAGEPKSYMLENGAILDVIHVDDGDAITIESDADLRTAPVVGKPEDGTRTTIATTKENVSLNNVKSYLVYENGDDVYYGFGYKDLKDAFPNLVVTEDMLVPDLENDSNENIGVVWANASKISVTSSSKR